MELESNLRYLKGIGEKKAVLYQKLGIHTIRELLFCTPRRYMDLRGELSIAALTNQEHGAIYGQVVQKTNGVKIRQGLTIYKVKVTDGVKDIYLTFYNTDYLIRNLQLNEWYIFYGKVASESGRPTLKNISIIPKEEKGYLKAVYSATAGLSSRMIAKDIQTALSICTQNIPSVVPDDVEQALQLPTLTHAIHNIHRPKNQELHSEAVKRLSLEELFPFCMALMQNRKELRCFTENLPEADLSNFWTRLPFSPTPSQVDAVSDIYADLCQKNRPMSRLIQGDVGSGKTVVAAAAAYLVASAGHQCVLMAPTEVLASQHYSGLTPIMEALGIQSALLTGSTPLKEKRLIKKAIANGEVQFIIGTHALLTDDTNFADLRLVITDEQHRFGVRQRSLLASRGKDIHTLVMSATPIPRTLSLLIFGDLEVSVMQSVPTGRLPIKTYLVGGDKRNRAYGFIQKHLDMGYQGYIVCTRVEEEEEEELLSAERTYKDLSKGLFKNYSVGLLHGKMKSKEKDKVMDAFRKGEIQLLISTSVIEVGVDVPNAVVMVIENAERFGLSQLHQLRGRVGRGSVQSYCVLITESPSQATHERLRFLAQNTDGFQIAQIDLELRGPGDFFGHRQHGLPSFQMSGMLDDPTLPEQIRGFCSTLIQNDPQLTQHPLLKAAVSRLREELQNTIN